MRMRLVMVGLMVSCATTPPPPAPRAGDSSKSVVVTPTPGGPFDFSRRDEAAPDGGVVSSEMSHPGRVPGTTLNALQVRPGGGPLR